MASAKPQTALKPPVFGQNMTPALQKFMNKQNEVLAGKESQRSNSEDAKTPNDILKAARNVLGPGGQGEKEVNNIPAVPATKNIPTKPTAVGAKPENRRGSQVIVPNIFKQDPVNVSSLSEGRRSSQTNVPEVSKPSPKNTAAFSEINSSDENTKPKPFAKPGSTFPRPPAGPKPQMSANSEAPGPAKTAQAVLPVSKKPSEIKSEEKIQQLFPRDSTKFKLPAMDNVPLKHITSASSGTTPLPSSSITSQSSSTSDEVKGTDLRSMLRPTKTQPANELIEKKKPAAIKPVFPPGGSSFAKVAETKAAQGVPDLPVQAAGNKWTPHAQEMKRQNSSIIVERKSDSKKFKKKNTEDYPASTPPKKPILPGNVDLTVVKQQYQRIIQMLIEKLDTCNDNGGEDNADELYDDGTSFADVVTRPSSNKRMSERISIIPDMTAEEEEEGAVYDDGRTPVSPLSVHRPPVLVPEADGMYVDAETERKVTEEEDPDQLYEDEETFALSAEKLEEERKRQQKEQAEAKKREEKERKEKEKEEEKKRKKEEKERAKKEKEEMALRKKFNLSGDETMVGEGVIKQDVKGGVLGGLSLKAGQTVTIVRLDNNPANKWLVRSNAGMGYIDSNIIEVDPAIIKQIMLCSVVASPLDEKHAPAALADTNAMTSQATAARRLQDDNDQPLYDDVPQDGRQNDLEDDSEIYEECP